MQELRQDRVEALGRGQAAFFHRGFGAPHSPMHDLPRQKGTDPGHIADQHAPQGMVGRRCAQPGCQLVHGDGNGQALLLGRGRHVRIAGPCRAQGVAVRADDLHRLEDAALGIEQENVGVAAHDFGHQIGRPLFGMIEGKSQHTLERGHLHRVQVGTPHPLAQQ